MPVWLGFLIALAVNAICSLGMVLQKKGIGWQTKGRERDVSWRHERRIWLLGFLLVFFVPFLNFIALYALSPAVVAAMVGSSVAFTALFSALILRVRFGVREIAASAVLFASIVAFALFTDQSVSSGWSGPFFVAAWVFPFTVAGTAWLLLRGRRACRGGPEKIPTAQSNPYGAIMGAVSGALGGLLIVIMKLFQIECGTDLLRYPLTPFMYAHLSVGVAGPYLLQLGYRRGSIGTVSSAFYGSQVVYPVIATWLIFALPPHPVQLAGLAGIIGSVLALTAGTGGEKRAAASVTPKADKSPLKTV